MTLKKQILCAVSLAAFTLSGCASGIGPDAVQASDPSKKLDITKLTCWDISTLPEEDAAYASILLYGYSAGKSGKSLHSGNGIESAIAKATEVCATHPDMMAIKAFK